MTSCLKDVRSLVNPLVLCQKGATLVERERNVEHRRTSSRPIGQR